jgi:hypothetical protein
MWPRSWARPIWTPLDDLENFISPERRPVTGAVLTMPAPVAFGPAALEPAPAPIYTPPPELPPFRCRE